MKTLSLSLLLTALVLTAPLEGRAQPARPVPYPVLPPPAFEQTIEQGTRTPRGEPGPNYWTNTADYTLSAELSPAAQQLQGEGTIRYYNNSPDILSEVYVHLRQNLHREGAARNRRVQVTGGMQIVEAAVDGTPLAEQAYGDTGYRIYGTIMRIQLPEPIPPGGSAEFAFRWSFSIPGPGAPRMGQDGDVFYLGYWYPQFAVYDDVSGWKADPYLGAGEFYMGYGTYDVALTVPDDHLVAATGVLQNPEAVLSEETRARLARAAETREVVPVVTAEERGSALQASPTGTHTWRFRAEDVRDFAFGTSAQYVWDATHAEVGDRDGDGTAETAMVHAFYRPDRPTWDRAAEFAQFSLAYLSDYLLPYPYPQMTLVEGLIGGGMEYPMITLMGGARSPRSLFHVTFHEISHMWIPMIVGQDEKQYAWMDEGLTSFNTHEGEAAFFGMDAWYPGRQRYYFIAGSGLEIPSMRHADAYPPGSGARTIAHYSKPAVALHALRGLFGKERFQEAYRTYIRRWAYKHPQPYDLFNTFEDVLGEDLDWFWTPMFYETWTLDHAIERVEAQAGGVVVQIADRGLTPMPVPVRVTYADGRVEEQTLPVSVWLGGAREAALTFEPGPVQRVEIDPGAFLPDVDRGNNTWVRE